MYYYTIINKIIKKSGSSSGVCLACVWWSVYKNKKRRE